MAAAPSPAPDNRARRGALPVLIGATALGVVAWLMFAPAVLSGFDSHPDPATTYEGALRRIDALRSADGGDVNPLCHLKLMTHGHRVARVVVLLHGLTNCPQQFEALGEVLYRRGANVLIARVPHHGLADRLTPDLARLTAGELTRFGDRVTDAGVGLGDSVTVAGLSLGAVVAAWIAQERRDVDRAIVIAPLFGVPQVWTPLTPGFTRVMRWIPNRFVWWDDQRRAAIPGPPYVYPRFSTRALGEILRLGAAVAAKARSAAPGAVSITLVTIARDPAISNPAALEVEESWRRRAPGRVRAYQFPERLHLGHDIVDPLQPYANTEAVYPVLADLMGARP